MFNQLLTEVPGYDVSTVKLPYRSPGQPAYETLVFRAGTFEDVDGYRSRTAAKARREHRAAVARWRRKAKKAANPEGNP